MRLNVEEASSYLNRRAIISGSAFSVKKSKQNAPRNIFQRSMCTVNLCAFSSEWCSW